MSELMPAVAMVLHAAGEQHGREFSEELKNALSSLADVEDPYEARRNLAEHLGDVDSPSAAGLIAVWFGAGVESGLDPKVSAFAILNQLLRWSRTLQTRSEEQPDAEDPEPDDETIFGMELLGQGLVAHVARSLKIRDEIAAQEQVVAELARVEHLSVGATWVLELLRQCSGELIVIHAEDRVGVRVRYENISNCFHLFTLLQDALAATMPGAERPSPEVVAAARGDSQVRVEGDHAWWHYGQGNVPEPDLMSMVFGEASPASIARVEGEQVMLLWKPILQSRGWSAGFFGPFLMAAPPDVRVLDQLTSAELDAWWKTLRLPALSLRPPAPSPAKPWWQLW